MVLGTVTWLESHCLYEGFSNSSYKLLDSRCSMIAHMMVNTRKLGTNSRNAARCKNRANSPKSDRTTPKAMALNLRRNHDCVWAEAPKSDEPPKWYDPPQTRLWHRIIQGVSANSHEHLLCSAEAWAIGSIPYKHHVLVFHTSLVLHSNS